jgi:hypothetical protein
MEDNYDNIKDNRTIFKGILYETEIKSQQKLIDIILLNEPDKLKELVYNINSTSCSMNEEKSTQINMNIDQSRVEETYYTMYESGEFNFNKYSHNYEIFNKPNNVINYKILENVFFNPSILSTFNHTYYPLLLVIKKDNLDIIIIQSTDIYLYSNDLILNILGNSINLVDKDEKIIDLQKNSEFIKFLSSNDINKFNTGYNILYCIILKFYGVKKKFNSNEVDFIEHIKRKVRYNHLENQINELVKCNDIRTDRWDDCLDMSKQWGI